MPEYSYRVFDAKKQTVQGILEAADEGAAEKALTRKGYRVLSLKAVPDKRPAPGPQLLAGGRPVSPDSEVTSPPVSFHFRVSDEAGSIRSGHLSARSLAEARAKLLKHGFTVLKLKRADEGLLVHEPAPPALKRPPKSITLPLLMRLRRRLPGERTIRSTLALVAVIGIFWTFLGWHSPGRGPEALAAPVPQATYTPFKLRVAGSVLTEPTAGWEDVQITVDLPDIPYQKTYAWTQLAHPAQGQFVAEVGVETTRPARSLVVRARKPGFGEAVSPRSQLEAGQQAVEGLVLRIPTKAN